MPESTPLPKMMIGFVIRRLVADLGREPTPEEFADWANHYRDDDRECCLFGREITATEAAVILRNRGRAVSARSAKPHETLPAEDGELPANVESLAAARARRAGHRRQRR